jgi:hypothetical protein
MRQTVVFKDDSLLHMFEKPGDCACNSRLATEVDIALEAVNLAWPIDIGSDVACFPAKRVFPDTMGTGAISGNEETGGSSCPDSLEDSPGEIGPIENEK